MDPFTITVAVFDTTKGAIHYKELDSNNQMYRYPNSPGALVGAVYVRKTTFNGGPTPRKFKITFEPIEE